MMTTRTALEEESEARRRAALEAKVVAVVQAEPRRWNAMGLARCLADGEVSSIDVLNAVFSAVGDGRLRYHGSRVQDPLMVNEKST